MARPCTCEKYVPGGIYRPDSGHCFLCHLWHNEPNNPVVRAWKGLPRLTVGPGCSPPEPDPPCDFESPGEPLDYAPCGCEPKHVRGCTGGHRRCSRGYLHGGAERGIQPCYRCPDRTIKGVKVGPGRPGLTPLTVTSG
jgi:hypothetical protein